MLLLAYGLLALGVLIGNGTLPGLPAVLACAVLVALVLGGRARASFSRRDLVVALIALGALGCVRRAGVALLPGTSPVPFWLANAALVATPVALLMRAPGRAATRAGLIFVLAVYAVVGGWLIVRAPAPRIDVFEFEQGAAVALEHGKNPYAMTFHNPYTADLTRLFFGAEKAPSTSLDSFPYPPLPMLVTTLGHALARDVRFALLAAQMIIGWLLWLVALDHGRAEADALAIACAFLLHPRGLFVLEQAWCDAVFAAAFLAFIAARGRARPIAKGLGAAILFGCFLAAKQISVLVAPLVVRRRTIGGFTRTQALAAFAIAALITLPFFAWGPRDFWHDVVLFQMRQPFRADALSLPAFVAFATRWQAPSALAFVAAAAALLWARRQTTADDDAGLALAAAFVYLVFFLTAKQAFCNYYYFVGALLLAAVAAQRAPAPSDPPR